MIVSLLKDAWHPTLKTCKWLLKLILPISLTVTLLQFYGILDWIAHYLDPLFTHLGLPGSSAVIFISGAAAGTYAGLAAMTALPLTLSQASIIGIMILVCHALPMECAVNQKTGSSAWEMAILRIIMAFFCAFVLNKILPANDEPYLYLGSAVDSTLKEVLLTWVFSQVKLALGIFAIVYSLMFVQQVLIAKSLLEPISNLLSPLMKFFGLPTSSAYMWLVGNVLGISYGSAVMVDLEEKGLITTNDANEVNYHLVMNHSIIEDTLLFSLTGISAILIILTRASLALIVVWCRKAFRKVFA